MTMTIKKKIVRRAAKIRADGAYSAACFDPPHAIDMTRATWVTDWREVTCKRCLALRPDNYLNNPFSLRGVDR